MGLRPRSVRYFVNHPAKLQIELDQLLMKHRDVLVVALDGLDVQAAVFILARIERQEIPPFPARDEHAALNLRLVFVGHSFEPGTDVDGPIERTLRLNAAVLANQAVRRAAQPVIFRVHHKARLDDGVAGQNFVKVVTRLLNLGTPSHRLAADRMLRSVRKAFKGQLTYVGGSGREWLTFAMLVTVPPSDHILEAAGSEASAAILMPLLGTLRADVKFEAGERQKVVDANFESQATITTLRAQAQRNADY